MRECKIQGGSKMSKVLIVVDMQNDFVTGSLGTKEAEGIVEAVVKKVESYRANGEEILFTRDTHTEQYLKTQEGKNLPVVHCVKGTEGWEIIDELKPYVGKVFDKPTFGSVQLAHFIAAGRYTEIEIVGLCTDICVVSNALLLKAALPEVKILTDRACCAGVTPESHEAALLTMKMCQIEVQ